MSRRNAALSAAAWCGSSGGQSRVLEKPGRGALAITPIAQSVPTLAGLHPMHQIPLKQLSWRPGFQSPNLSLVGVAILKGRPCGVGKLSCKDLNEGGVPGRRKTML